MESINQELEFIFIELKFVLALAIAVGRSFTASTSDFQVHVWYANSGF